MSRDASQIQVEEPVPFHPIDCTLLADSNCHLTWRTRQQRAQYNDGLSLQYCCHTTPCRTLYRAHHGRCSPRQPILRGSKVWHLTLRATEVTASRRRGRSAAAQNTVTIGMGCLETVPTHAVNSAVHCSWRCHAAGARQVVKLVKAPCLKARES